MTSLLDVSDPKKMGDATTFLGLKAVECVDMYRLTDAEIMFVLFNVTATMCARLSPDMQASTIYNLRNQFGKAVRTIQGYNESGVVP